MSLTEETRLHTRIMRCDLAIDACTAYWSRHTPETPLSAVQAYQDMVFGAKSMARVKRLLENLRARFDAYPHCLSTLHDWHPMRLEDRSCIAHVHLQLSDPLYRAFTGDWLVAQREEGRSFTRDAVVRWVGDLEPGRWQHASQVQLASKLLSAARAAGLAKGRIDPRQTDLPPVSDAALTYVLYLLRPIDFDGSLIANPYLGSLGLVGDDLHARLRGLDSLDFARQGDATEFAWAHPDLASWSRARTAA